jgi:hypothetical protein
MEMTAPQVGEIWACRWKKDLDDEYFIIYLITYVDLIMQDIVMSVLWSEVGDEIGEIINYRLSWFNSHDGNPVRLFKLL